ncbi:MAG: response regulator [Leptolyngbyaceae cyanobacterium MO_188.B28]|nr:response regulator [Leptolyngbyaceae cyanobacterium MO_188.B28]
MTKAYAAQKSSKGSKGRILIVEDDYANRILIADYLEHCRYTVLGLQDGLHLFQNLESFQPELILLDIKLPKIDGFTLIQQIQQHVNWRHLPIVVVSGYAFKADQQRALALGARRYLVKPVKIDELQQVVQEELVRSRQE